MHALSAQIAALGRSQAMIEFTIDGKILSANENFLATMGYSLEEVRGQHHSMFVEPAYRDSAEYRMFWEKLARGEFDAGQYKRVRKGGNVVWLQASYNPVLDANGKAMKVIKLATNITAAKTEQLNAERITFRLKAALDTCQTNVMVADEAYNIVYMNNTMTEMIRAAEVRTAHGCAGSR